METLVVLTIMALLLGLLPRLDVGLEHARLRSAADKVAALLERAHVAALTSGETVAIAVDSAAKLLSGPRLRLRLEGTVTKIALTRNVEFGGDGELRFYPDGSADGGELQLLSKHAQEKVTIDWVTGHVARSR